MPDKCKCVDFQVLKLQESPDAVPHGEMPRHMQLYCDRLVVDKSFKFVVRTFFRNKELNEFHKLFMCCGSFLSSPTWLLYISSQGGSGHRKTSVILFSLSFPRVNTLPLPRMQFIYI